MKPEINLHQIFKLPRPDLQPLLEESKQEGYEFIDRLASEYIEGTNRFDKRGEALFAVYERKTLIAIGGINQDPYLQKNDTGRVRHLYVLPSHRRQGIGSLLMNEIIAHGKKHFKMLALRTFNPQADIFYRQLGFQTRPKIEFASHTMKFGKS